MRALGARLVLVPYDAGVEGARGARLSRRRGHVRASVRRPRLHRRARHHGAGDPRGRAGHGRGHRRHRRRRADHRRRQRHQGAAARRSRSGAPSRRPPRRRRCSFATGSPQVFPDWKASFVDGAGGKSVFPRMWERMRPLVDGYIVVTLDETRRAMRLMAEKARVIAEGAGALPLAAALTGKAGQGPIVAIVSGGNIDLDEVRRARRRRLDASGDAGGAKRPGAILGPGIKADFIPHLFERFNGLRPHNCPADELPIEQCGGSARPRRVQSRWSRSVRCRRR